MKAPFLKIIINTKTLIEIIIINKNLTSYLYTQNKYNIVK